MHLSALFLFSLFTVAGYGAEIRLTHPDELKAALEKATPGQVFLLPEGEWKDVKLLFQAKGTSEAPITLRGAPGGKTVFTGRSLLRIAGERLVVENLHFRDPDPAAGDTIEFRASSKAAAYHCRLSNCAVTLGPDTPGNDAVENRWINLYGSDNRVDRCTVTGKRNRGATLVVWLGPGQEGRHQIDHNYFGPRQRLGLNGGETIRIGNSETSMQSARCIVESNLFERCDGEAECISNKSCDNIYRENSFLAVSGTLTLRHGNRCLVEQNVFLGQEGKGTGGIRVIGEEHIVRGNYLEGLTGKDARAGISFMQGVPDSKANEYFQVKGARIEGNTLVNCSSPILIGLRDHKRAALAPADTVFANNRISAPNRKVVEARCPIDGVQWSGNVFFGGELGIAPVDGIQWQEPAIEKRSPIARSEVGAAWLR